VDLILNFITLFAKIAHDFSNFLLLSSICDFIAGAIKGHYLFSLFTQLRNHYFSSLYVDNFLQDYSKSIYFLNYNHIFIFNYLIALLKNTKIMPPFLGINNAFIVIDYFSSKIFKLVFQNLIFFLDSLNLTKYFP